MRDTELWAPSTVKQVMKEHGIHMKKRLGQNFLVDKNILQKVVGAAAPTAEEYIIEIGPGLGVLTAELANQAKRVLALEIDRDLIKVLAETIPSGNVSVVHCDALKEEWAELLKKAGWVGESVKLVANLPYYLTTPLIMKALEGEVPFSRIVVMVQKEVAQRILADPGTKNFGILSLAIQYYSKPQLVAYVPRSVFFPSPDVDSAVIRLDTISPPVSAPREQLFEVIRACFSQRRKTMRNSLRSLATEWGLGMTELEEAITQTGLDLTVRGETLSMEMFSALTTNLLSYKKTPVE